MDNRILKLLKPLAASIQKIQKTNPPTKKSALKKPNLKKKKKTKKPTSKKAKKQKRSK